MLSPLCISALYSLPPTHHQAVTNITQTCTHLGVYVYIHTQVDTKCAYAFTCIGMYRFFPTLLFHFCPQRFLSLGLRDIALSSIFANFKPKLSTHVNFVKHSAPFCRRGSWGSEKFNEGHRRALLSKGRGGLQTRVCDSNPGLVIPTAKLRVQPLTCCRGPKVPFSRAPFLLSPDALPTPTISLP